MLYEMIAIVRPGRLSEVKELAYQAGSIIINSGGVVRGITNWGTYLLAKPKVRIQTLQDSGHHFIMRFDCSPVAQRHMRKTIAIDPRMLRCGVVRLGKTLEDIHDVKGTVPWRRPHVEDNTEDLLRFGS